MIKKLNNTLLTRYFSGNCTPSEKREVELLLKTKDNKHNFNLYNTIWKHSSPANTNYTPDIEELWGDLNRRIYYTEQFLQTEHTHKKLSRTKLVYALSKVAAVFVLLFEAII